MASKIKLSNANGKIVTIENNDSNMSDVTLNGASITKKVDTLADMRVINELPETVWCSGYHSKNDGAFGSNFYRLKGLKTTETDNSGTIIIVSVSGSDYVYELQYDGAVNVKWFGAVGDGITDDTTAFTDADATRNASIKGTYALKNFSVYRQQLFGSGRYETTLNAVGNDSSIIIATGNDGAIKDLLVSGNSKTGITGIEMINGNKFSTLDNVRISACDIGLDLSGCTYSSFNDVMIALSTDTAIKIGEANSSTWLGDLRFYHTYIPSGRRAILVGATSTTAITFRETTIEGNFIGYENYGYFEDHSGYCGDGGRYTLLGTDVLSESCAYLGHPGSYANFYSGNPLSGASNWTKSDLSIQSQIRLVGASDSPARISVTDKGIVLNNQYDTGAVAGTRRQYSYQATEYDTVEFNNVACVKSTAHNNHNQAPFLLYPDYTPLRSKVPKNNYILNGTFANSEYNTQIENKSMYPSSYGTQTIDTTLMNQYGGYIFQHRHVYSTKLRYTVPDSMVGKKMILITYTCSVESNSNGPKIILGDGYSDCSESGSLSFTRPVPSYAFDRRAPLRKYIEFTPTKKQGVIHMHTNSYEAGVAPGFDLASIILTEYENRYLLDQFIDVNEVGTGSGITANRPVVAPIGEQYFDTTLGYSVNWNGSHWVKYDGTTA